jgi:predicted metal-dependent peptidase
MENNTEERLKNLIARFVLKYNYWGYLFSRIRRKAKTGFGSIMAVGPEPDGTISLFYEPNLVDKTDDQQILRIIEHEGMHLLNKHIPRLLRILANEVDQKRKTMKMQVFNIAADCSVNVQANIRDPIIIDSKPWPPMLPAMFELEEGKITEDYYLELLKRHDDLMEMLKKSGMLGNEAFGDHKEWIEGTGTIADLNSFSRKVDQHMQNIIKESVKGFNKDRSSLPGHIAQLIEEALQPPKAPYYQIIRKLIKGSRFTKFKRSPTRINKKRAYTFTLKEKDEFIPEISPFPGKTRDTTFDIVVLVDTSGSMSNEDVLEGLSGIKNIIENDRHCYTTVLEVDATVEREYRVKKVRDIRFDIKGRGGTTLRPGLERARQLGCDVCLAFTDGYTDNINEIDRKVLPKKLIWVITSGGTAQSVNKTGYVVKI